MRIGLPGWVSVLLISVPQLEMQPLVPFLAVPGALRWVSLVLHDREIESSPAVLCGIGAEFRGDTALTPDVAAGIEGTWIQARPVPGTAIVWPLSTTFLWRVRGNRATNEEKDKPEDRKQQHQLWLEMAVHPH